MIKKKRVKLTSSQFNSLKRGLAYPPTLPSGWGTGFRTPDSGSKDQRVTTTPLENECPSCFTTRTVERHVGYAPTYFAWKANSLATGIMAHEVKIIVLHSLTAG